MIFWSDSGYGGERGHWEIHPDDHTIYDGITEYPSGQRSWIIELPSLEAGTHTFKINFGCSEGADPASFALSAEFELTG